MAAPLVVIDADVLGRQRTGDETYVTGLLGELAGTPDFRLAAVTRRPELVPDGIEPIELRARSQVWRMGVALPLLLRRLRPALAHFQHALPLTCPCPAVVTVHDLSFERDPSLMGLSDRVIFRTAVPRSARRAERVLAVSERTKRDLIELYEIPAENVVVTPNGVDRSFSPEGPLEDGAAPYALVVGTLQRRKDPEAAIEALALLGDATLRLVFAGPDKGGRPAAQRAAERNGLGDRVEFRGHVPQEELARLYRGAACLVFPSRYEGFGLPALEAMATGTPVVATAAGALPEVAGDAAILVERNPAALAGGIERALADRERLVAAGLERAKQFSWAQTAARTLEVYREILSR